LSHNALLFPLTCSCERLSAFRGYAQIAFTYLKGRMPADFQK